MLKESKDINPVELLQKLIQFNTTNPPGNENECIRYIEKLLSEVGIETKIVGKTQRRTNLIARLKGDGSAAPFLMYGHVDVVTTENQTWKHSPFKGTIDDDCVYGRGTLDMKGAIAMMVSSLIKIKTSKIIPHCDIILCIVSDEESDGKYGARYVVENYAHLFENVKYAIGEVGGFTMYIGEKKFYPIMVAEKQRCCLKIVTRGKGGHGSMPIHDGAMAKLGSILTALDQKKLPAHITQPAKIMINEMAKNFEPQIGEILKGLTNPSECDKILEVLGNKMSFFDPILHNSVSPTIVRGGNKINVIPSEITLELDGRILPGYSVENILDEVKSIIGEIGEISVTSYDPGPQLVDLKMFNTLSDIIKEGDKEGIPIPFVMAGVTDARFFSKLGIQTYGFTPMLFPKDIMYSKLIHASNERIPLKALEFGTNSIFKLLNTIR
ncbi:M20/M25/M40 family metallo-hydrolase [Clostridium felsineum]|uniref:Succinyl-diaminopimelate desuccinylase n=1 Tax=Clostridium felsineum TaxID=36839 RepID=A0A1S8KZR9_9CLOT|nr:M20/M25/M40 family metallo-hydrolase [Clostridium felsineum]URZ07041.1 putative succinyl-diaminopimelate desuccinylase [Clostridium felsineum]URZ12071.1 putative succinyl-diaminopimelate desuccinylase [Clostridium felsineum]